MEFAVLVITGDKLFFPMLRTDFFRHVEIQNTNVADGEFRVYLVKIRLIGFYANNREKSENQKGYPYIDSLLSCNLI